MPLPTVEALATALASHVEDEPEAVNATAAQALDRVTKIVGTRADVVPDSIAMQAAVDLGAELYFRRRIRHGIVQMGDAEGGVQPVRVNRNPDAVVYPTLAPWLGAGIA